MTLPHLDEFLLSIQSNNYSSETLYNYERDLKVFESFLETELTGRDFLKLNKRDLELYKAYLTSRDRRTAAQTKPQQNLSAPSINRHLSSVRRYLQYLIEMDYATSILPQNLKLIKTPKRVPKVAEMTDLVRLIESPSTLEKNSFVAKRNRAMLEILFATGMRISELLQLNRAQLDNSGKIFIMGKGKKERFVYLTPRAWRLVGEYLKTRQDTLPALFIPYRGRNVLKKNARVSANYLQAKIKSYRERLGINVPTSAHSLRHGFATYLAESGANPAAIQILLGHESLDTTTRYVHASDQYAEKSHRQFHPLKE